MAMDLGGAKGGIKSDINVTPLVDVMLVLLIIMMIVAPMLQQGVQLRLPKANNTQSKPESSEQTVLAIAANRSLYLNSRQVQESELATKIHASWREMIQAGICRPAVRGFSASMRASLMRLRPMAALRAPTMARQIQPIWAPVGGWPLARDARVAPIRAKGKAKTVWENLIISRRWRILENMGLAYRGKC